MSDTTDNQRILILPENVANMIADNWGLIFRYVVMICIFFGHAAFPVLSHGPFSIATASALLHPILQSHSRQLRKFTEPQAVRYQSAGLWRTPLAMTEHLPESGQTEGTRELLRLLGTDQNESRIV